MMPLTHITIYFIAAMHIEKETPIRKVIPSEKKNTWILVITKSVLKMCLIGSLLSKLSIKIIKYFLWATMRCFLHTKRTNTIYSLSSFQKLLFIYFFFRWCIYISACLITPGTYPYLLGFCFNLSIDKASHISVTFIGVRKCQDILGCTTRSQITIIQLFLGTIFNGIVALITT
jgi:hypothetical protein